MPARQRQRRRLTQVLRATNGTLVGHDLIDFAGSTGGGSGLAVITHAGKTFLLTLIAVAKVSTAVHFGAAVGEFARTLFVITNLRRYRPIGQRQLITSRDATGAKTTLGRIQICFVLITGETHVVGSNTAIAAKIDLAIATNTLETTLQVVLFRLFAQRLFVQAFDLSQGQPVGTVLCALLDLHRFRGGLAARATHELAGRIDQMLEGRVEVRGERGGGQQVSQVQDRELVGDGVKLFGCTERVKRFGPTRSTGSDTFVGGVHGGDGAIGALTAQ